MSTNGDKPVQRLAVTMKEAGVMSGLSQPTLYRRIKLGDLETTTVGRRRLVQLASLKRLIGAE